MGKKRRIDKPSLYSEYQVGKATTITLMRTAPGQEKDVLTQLCADFAGATIYKVFGDSDFAVIQQFPNQPVPMALSNSYRDKGVSYISTLSAFSWDGLDSLPFEGLKDYPVVGISLLKLNNIFVNRFGIRGDLSVLQEIKKQIHSQNDIRAGVFGTLGWFELMLLICGQQMEDVLKFTSGLRRAVAISDDGIKFKLPCFQTTTTIPAILCEKGEVKADVQTGNGINLELRASCYSWSDSKVEKILEKEFKKPHYVVGTDDFVIDSFQMNSLSEYVNKLWSLRFRAKDMIYRTHTSLILANTDGLNSAISNKTERPLLIDVDLEHIALKSLQNSSPTLFNEFADTFSSLNDILSTVDRSDAVLDLTASAKEFINSLVPSDVHLDLPIIGKYLEVLRYGMQQRYIGTGTLNYIWPVMASHVGGNGGIQRILTAASTVPSGMLNNFDKKWDGFVVVGFTDDYHRFYGGIINLPTEVLNSPNQWFGLFHEVGHEYATQIDLMNDPAIREALADADLYSEEQILEISEVYAEIFAYLFGFGGDFDSCLKSTWQYLSTIEKVKKNPESFFLRFLMTYIFSLEENSDIYVGKIKDIEKLARKLKQKLSDYSGIVNLLDDTNIQDVSSTVFALRVVLDLIRERLPNKRLNMASFDQNYSKLYEGKVLINLEEPISFLKDFAISRQEYSFRSVIAAILTLWNYKVTIEK